MLQHYTSKANAEQKASGDGRANSGAAAKTEKKTTLSSTAMESLRRAMGNYLKGGKKQEAAALAQRYGSRMNGHAEKAAEEAVWHIWSQFDHIRKAPPSAFGKGALFAKWSWRVKDRGLTGGRFLLQ